MSSKFGLVEILRDLAEQAFGFAFEKSEKQSRRTMTYWTKMQVGQSPAVVVQQLRELADNIEKNLVKRGE